MNAQDFCYWLQGFAEVGKATPTDEQWKIIQDHLNLVFNKVTPVYSPYSRSSLDSPYCSSLSGTGYSSIAVERFPLFDPPNVTC